MNISLSNIVPLASLIVAGLAVFVGPVVTYIVATEKNKASARVSNKQIIAPIRQAWIDNLRNLIAEITGKSLHYWTSGYEDREDSEYLHITELVHKLELYLNIAEPDHAYLLKRVHDMVNLLSSSPSSENSNKFQNIHIDVISTSREILKREWERVKNEI
ncbi:hypothetical protein Misp06_01797 [Microbulbifer sp. NBRC 101763]|uniref:hypothetical protein n=1 Tax=Microbulbifer sp. NBRC 101763 TaxID=1113820 RepID=UPI003098805C